MPSKRHPLLAATVLVLLAGWGCTKSTNTPSTGGVTPNSGTAQKSDLSSKSGGSGVASWYGHPFDGRLTANGEVYNMEKLTAAHRTFAFGTVLLVKNRSNGKTVQVRVNDRGPFVANRVIDLSHAAAQQIAMPSIASVDLGVVSIPRTRAVQNFAVQLGSFATEAEARALTERMQKQYGTARTIFRPGDETWRVLVGSLPSIEDANVFAGQLAKEGPTPFVVLLDEDD